MTSRGLRTTASLLVLTVSPLYIHISNGESGIIHSAAQVSHYSSPTYSASSFTSTLVPVYLCVHTYTQS